MIGGADVTFDVPAGPSALDYAVRLVASFWADCVFVADDDPTVVTRLDRLAFHGRSEVIVYRDVAACAAWRTIGYDDSLRGTMLYLISDPTELTIVIDDEPPAEITEMLAMIRQGLPSAIPLLMLPLPEAA